MLCLLWACVVIAMPKVFCKPAGMPMHVHFSFSPLLKRFVSVMGCFWNGVAFSQHTGTAGTMLFYTLRLARCYT
jgi:hypothetical protein